MPMKNRSDVARRNFSCRNSGLLKRGSPFSARAPKKSRKGAEQNDQLERDRDIRRQTEERLAADIERIVDGIRPPLQQQSDDHSPVMPQTKTIQGKRVLRIPMARSMPWIGIGRVAVPASHTRFAHRPRCASTAPR